MAWLDFTWLKFTKWKHFFLLESHSCMLSILLTCTSLVYFTSLKLPSLNTSNDVISTPHEAVAGKNILGVSNRLGWDYSSLNMWIPSCEQYQKYKPFVLFSLFPSPISTVTIPYPCFPLPNSFLLIPYLQWMTLPTPWQRTPRLAERNSFSFLIDDLLLSY